MARKLHYGGMMKKLFPALVILCIILVLMLSGQWVNSRNMDWYATLNKPGFTPPGWFIGMMWTLIYTLSGIAAWLVWARTPHDDRFRMITAFAALNVLLNGSWSFIFFGLHMMLTAVVVAGVLAVTVWIIMWLIGSRQKIAVALLIPYAFWTPFATFLAYTIYRLNV